MIREIDLAEISDGKRYSSNDMARIGCDGCKGCSACCKNMEAIVLDPFDIYNLSKGTGNTFSELLNDKIEVGIVDGVLLPNIRMDLNTGACNFLDTAGRCSIHAYRPGICRLFPLGRIYENGKFDYFIQKYECKKTNLSKVKIANWLDIPNIKKYESFVLEWHDLIKELGEDMKNSQSDVMRKKIGMVFLNIFYATPYDTEADFYEQFKERINKIKGV